MKNLSKILISFIFLFGTFFYCPGQEQEIFPTPTGSKGIKSEALFTEGEKYFILEDFGKAIEYYRRANEIEQFAGIHFKIAESLIKDETSASRELAIGEIEKALKLDGQNKFYYQFASELYESTGRFKRATELLEELVKRFPGNSDQLFTISSLYQLQGKQGEALDALDRAEKVFGVNETGAIQKMELLSAMGKLRQAEEEGKKLTEAFPGETRYLVGLANLIIQQGRLAEAGELLSKVQPSDDIGGLGRIMLIEVLVKTKNFDQSFKIAFELINDQSVDLNNKIVAIKNIQSSVDLKNPLMSDQLTKLIDHLKISDPEAPDVWLTAADLSMELGQLKVAASDYLKAIRRGATAFQAWSNLLILESQENMIDSLVLHSEEAMEIFPNQPELWYFNGYGHFQKRNFKNACSSLEQAKLLSGDAKFILDVLLMLGDAYHAAGDNIKSDESFEQALKMEPNQDLALNNYSFYLALRKDKLERAEELSTRLIKKFPTNNTYLDTYAWVLFARGKYNEAKKIMEQIVSSGSASAVHLEHYGDILFKLGETENAVKQWELALSLNSRNDNLRKKILNRKLN